jgi:hypothetical protein
MRDVPYPQRHYADIKRFCSLGVLAGTLLAILILLSSNGSTRTILAGISSGAWFGFSLGMIAAVFLRTILSALCIGSLLGGFAGLIWWVVAGDFSSFSSSMIIGSGLGMVFVLLTQPWKS